MIGTFLAALLFQPAAQAAPAADRVPMQGYEIVRTYPHDPQAFTQGLLYLDGSLYESTGQIGGSTIRKVSLADGRVLKSASVPRPHFGEGLVNWGSELLSITWQSGLGFRWDRESFRKLGEFRYFGEGWGLTQNGRDIIMSDGTPELRFLDPRTLAERKRVKVTLRGRPLPYLNELEWVNGEVYANVWQTDYIVRINPESGKVVGLIDLRGLQAKAGRSGTDEVLNGIAYDAKGNRLFVTGKRWPTLYEIKLTAPR